MEMCLLDLDVISDLNKSCFSSGMDSAPATSVT